MFCVHCGTQLPDVARFCSACGQSLTEQQPPPATSPHASTPQAHAQYPTVASPTHQQPAAGHPLTHQTQYAHVPYQQVHAVSPQSIAVTAAHTQSRVLLSETGYPQAGFERLAASLFHALDQTIAPQRTGMLEVPKMAAYRTLGGLTVPPYFGEHVLPTYCSVVGVELALGQPANSPAVTWNGWHHYLLHKVKLEPETTFMHLLRVGAALGLQLNLQRLDFPHMPDPNAQAKEAQFKTRIYAMARGAFGTRTVGGMARYGGFSGQAQAHAHNQSKSNSKLTFDILKGVAKFANYEMNGGGNGGFF